MDFDLSRARKRTLGMPFVSREGPWDAGDDAVDDGSRGGDSQGGLEMTPPRALGRQYAALPYTVDSEGEVHVLLITSRGTGRWVLPKGWPDGAETGPEAAAREAVEESGVVGRIDPQDPLGCYHYMKRFQFGRSVPCRVTVFGLSVDGFKADFRDKGRRVLRWCSPEYGAGLVHEPELADLLMRFSAAAPADGRPAPVPSL